MPNINTLILKSDYDTKLQKLSNCNYVSNSGFDSKLAQANVITKENFDQKLLRSKIIFKKLQTFDSSYFRGKN